MKKGSTKGIPGFVLEPGFDVGISPLDYWNQNRLKRVIRHQHIVGLVLFYFLNQNLLSELSL